MDFGFEPYRVPDSDQGGEGMKACVAKWLEEQFAGDAGMVETVYAEYRKTLSDLMDKLRVARQTGDSVAVDRVLHTIKGSAAMVGDNETANLAAEARQVLDVAGLDLREAALKRLAEEL